MGRVGYASRRRIGRIPKRQGKVAQEQDNLDTVSRNERSKSRHRKSDTKPTPQKADRNDQKSETRSSQTPPARASDSLDNYLAHFGRPPRSSRAKTLQNIQNFIKFEGWRRRSSGATGRSRRQVRDRSCISQTIPEVILVDEDEQNDRPVELSPADFGRMTIAESTTTPVVEEPDDEDPINALALRQIKRRVYADECPAGKPVIRVTLGHRTFETKRPICSEMLRPALLNSTVRIDKRLNTAPWFKGPHTLIADFAAF
ncbi:hypothetical protein Ddc_13145 [Ditylenchus destructor]|nr:hypothetical protein Ddc_13145 [Ditylenchus destructor]